MASTGQIKMDHVNLLQTPQKRQWSLLPSIIKGDPNPVSLPDGQKKDGVYGGSLGNVQNLRDFIVDPFIQDHGLQKVYLIAGDEQTYESL